MPRWPAFSMQPCMRPRLGSEWEHYGAARFRVAAPCATSRRGWSRVLVQPLYNAASERLSLGLGARQSAVEFRNSRPFVEERPPVLGRPAVGTGAQHCYDFSFVPSQRVDDGPVAP